MAHGLLGSMSDREHQTVFVTVGTTCFDALVTAVDSSEVKKALLQKGYSNLLIQMGRGTYVPSKVSGDATLQVDHFTFSPSIADNMRTASLVISHAGSGSIFETLRLGKPLIVVVNEDLMDNHQSELAEELAERKHLFSMGKRPDIFVVNSFGSGFQALFVFLLLPFLSNLRGIKFAELPAYLNGGAECFLNVAESPIDCGGAPFLPLLFIVVNMAFNISLLNLVKMSSALVASLTATSAVPISIYILSLPLPYIPHGAELSMSFIIGAVVLLMGLILYNLPQSSLKQLKAD